MEMTHSQRLAASLAHHQTRLARAVMAKDYPAMRDAQKVIRDMQAAMRPCA